MLKQPLATREILLMKLINYVMWGFLTLATVYLVLSTMTNPIRNILKKYNLESMTLRYWLALILSLICIGFASMELTLWVSVFGTVSWYILYLRDNSIPTQVLMVSLLTIIWVVNLMLLLQSIGATR